MFEFENKWFAYGNWTLAAALPPNVAYHLQNQPTVFTAFQCIAACLSSLALLFALIQFVAFRRVGNQLRELRGSVFLPSRTELLLSIAIFPSVVSICQLMGLIFVRQARLVLLLSDIYMATILWRFWSLLVGLSGGSETVVAAAASKKPFRVFAALPLCCLGFLTSKRRFVARDLRWSRWAVWQFTVLVPIASLIRAFNNGVVNIEQLLNFGTTGSMFVCMWGLHVLTKVIDPSLFNNNSVIIRLVVEVTVIGTRLITLVTGFNGLIEGRNEVYTESVMSMGVTNFCINVLSSFTALLSFCAFSATKLHKDEVFRLEATHNSSHHPSDSISPSKYHESQYYDSIVRTPVGAEVNPIRTPVPFRTTPARQAVGIPMEKSQPVHTSLMGRLQNLWVRHPYTSSTPRTSPSSSQQMRPHLSPFDPTLGHMGGALESISESFSPLHEVKNVLEECIIDVQHQHQGQACVNREILFDNKEEYKDGLSNVVQMHVDLSPATATTTPPTSTSSKSGIVISSQEDDNTKPLLPPLGVHPTSYLPSASSTPAATPFSPSTFQVAGGNTSRSETLVWTPRNPSPLAGLRSRLAGRTPMAS